MTLPPAYSDNQELIAELRSFATQSELQASESYRKHEARLSNLLDTPRLFTAGETRPCLHDFLRIAHWNLEKGKHLDAAIEALRRHPVLRCADLISINEADVGMNRSGQRFVALELGQALGMHVAFAPVYLEFSKGYGDDLTMPGENTIALQGNAILSRYAFSNLRIIRLPVCYDHFEHAEKRIGNRNALAADVEINGHTLTFVTTHLEVRNSPACRARQMAAIIDELEKPSTPSSAIIAGDFNSNTFARGGRWRTLRGFARMLLSNPEKLMRQTAAPQSREPLFDLLYRHGFTERGFNSEAITCRVPLNILEDRSRLPAIFTRIIEHRLAAYHNQLDFRLDWIIARNAQPLSDGEVTDSATGTASLSPQTITGLKNERGTQISDHDPITADLIIR
ncbi:MAG TPA: endonuclease/exonuclease/phosphatase family protein [Blastocatellia bacterium]|nr:endonuclease/exonuclease/phosphatase family protein [Blastocatellia bacterium]